MSGSEGQEVTGDRKRLHYEELRDLYCRPNSPGEPMMER